MWNGVISQISSSWISRISLCMYTEGLLLCPYYCLQLEEGELHLVFVFSVLVIMIHSYQNCGVVFSFSFLLVFVRIYGSWYIFQNQTVTLCINCINEFFIKYLIHSKTLFFRRSYSFLQKGFLNLSGFNAFIYSSTGLK